MGSGGPPGVAEIDLKTNHGFNSGVWETTLDVHHPPLGNRCHQGSPRPRWRFAALAQVGWLAAFLTSCGTPSEPSPNPRVETPVAPGDEETQPRVQAVLAESGRVVSVNSRLRFVVLDFGFNMLPEPGTVMEVHRNGRRTGELRVSGPSRGGATVADIIAGDARRGDEAHPKSSIASESSK